MNRSAATVGAQYGPAPSCGSGSGIPAAISPAAGGELEDQAQPLFADAGEFGQPLTSRTPRPPLRSSGTGAAPKVSSSRSTSRSRSMTAPAATASTSAAVVCRHRGIGRGQLDRSGDLRRAAPDRPAGAGSRFRRRPAGQPRSQQPGHRPVRRGAGRRIAGSAHRRPLREALQQLPLCVVERPRAGSAISSPVCSAPSRTACPGYQGTPAAASAATRTSASPHTSARSRRSSTAASTASSPARSPIRAVSLVSGTGTVSACSVSRPSSTASRRKSSSSVAAFTDCLACARAARAAMLPGGGWVRSGRNSSSRISRSSGKSASQAPSGVPELCSVIADQRKAVRRSRQCARRLRQYGAWQRRSRRSSTSTRLAGRRTARTITPSASWPPTAPVRCRRSGS